jgi:hypothetical protein
MGSTKAVRAAGRSNLLSRTSAHTPANDAAAGTMTAPATTGPANAPRPASSTPATQPYPAAQSRVSSSKVGVAPAAVRTGIVDEVIASQSQFQHCSFKIAKEHRQRADALLTTKESLRKIKP